MLNEREPPAESVRTRVMIYSAIDAFVHHIFEPLITHSSLSFRALVTTPPCKSEPAPDSVRASAASLFFPLATSGSHFFLRSSLPYRTIGVVPSPLCAAIASAVEPHPQPSSSIAIATLTASTPEPPYSSGIFSPSNPRGPILCVAVQLNSPVTSTS